MNSRVKTINEVLTAKIEKLEASGNNLLDIFNDLIELDGYDAPDLIESLPDSIVYRLKLELAKRNFSEAKHVCPETKSKKISEDMFR